MSYEIRSANPPAIQRLLFFILVLSATCFSASAQRFVKVFDNIAAMLAANPNDVHTNAFVTGHTTANDGRGGIYTWNSTSTAATNQNLSVLKANNFATGRWFRDNGFVLSNFTTNTVAVIGPNGILTNSVITITEINTLIGIGGNIQQQINNLIALDTNWENDGATNANLVGIARVWKLVATNSVEVGQVGETGRIDIGSTNGTYTGTITMTNNGSMLFTNTGPFDDFDIGAFVFYPTNLQSADIVQFWNPLVDDEHPAAMIQSAGTFLGKGFYVEDSWQGTSFTRIQPGNDITHNLDPANRFVVDMLNSTNILLTHDGTNVFRVNQDSGYTGAGTGFLSDDGNYYAVTSPPGAVVTNITMNPTVGALPVKVSATAFGDSAISTNGTNIVISGDTFARAPVYSGQNSEAFVGVLFPTAKWPGFYGISSLANDGFGKGRMVISSADSSSVNGSSFLDVVATTTASATNVNEKLSSNRSGGANSFTWERNADPYTATNNWMRLTSNSVPLLAVTATGGFLVQNGSGIFNTLNDGSAASPAYGFNGISAGIGMYRDANGEPNIAVGSSSHFRVSSSGVNVGGTDSYLWRSGAPDTTTVRNGMYSGSGTPEGSVTANVGSTFLRTDGGANTIFYIKETGSGNTGWVANARNGQIGAACSDETTALTTGTNKVRFRMPYAMTVTAVRASLTTAQTAGSILTVDINEGGTSILSTKITIDDNETTSTTAATPPVISDTALADDAIITVDIDQVGTSPAGLKIWIIGTY